MGFFDFLNFWNRRNDYFDVFLEEFKTCRSKIISLEKAIRFLHREALSRGDPVARSEDWSAYRKERIKVLNRLKTAMKELEKQVAADVWVADETPKRKNN